MRAWVIQNKIDGTFLTANERDYTDILEKAHLYKTREEARKMNVINEWWNSENERVKKVNVNVTLI